MRYVIFWIIALTVLFFITSRNARAEDWGVRFGPGFEGQQLTGATKAFGLRREEELMDGIYDAVELGGYVDNSGHGRKSAGVVKLGVGVKPGPEVGVYGFGFVGPCGISATDTYLSTGFEFCTDIGLGVRDRKTFMSAGYSHISNAGIKLPNRGKDWAIFSIGVTF
jgi:hypothetical protein